jgi:mannitol-1-/sugar-/sorbitol-6-/2-deoxyglucose-6-phosphatase
LKNVIFDLDGVLINSEHLWRRAYPIAFEERFGRSAPDIDLAMLQGQQFRTVAAHFIEGSGIAQQESDRELARGFANAVLEVVLRLVHLEAAPIEGSLETLHWLKSQGVRLALASSSPRALVSRELALLDLTEIFDFHRDRR